MQHDSTKQVEMDMHFIYKKSKGGLICTPNVPISQELNMDTLILKVFL